MHKAIGPTPPMNVPITLDSPYVGVDLPMALPVHLPPIVALGPVDMQDVRIQVIVTPSLVRQILSVRMHVQAPTIPVQALVV